MDTAINTGFVSRARQRIRNPRGSLLTPLRDRWRTSRARKRDLMYRHYYWRLKCTGDGKVRNAHEGPRHVAPSTFEDNALHVCTQSNVLGDSKSLVSHRFFAVSCNRGFTNNGGLDRATGWFLRVPAQSLYIAQRGNSSFSTRGSQGESTGIGHFTKKAICDSRIFTTRTQFPVTTNWRHFPNCNAFRVGCHAGTAKGVPLGAELE